MRHSARRKGTSAPLGAWSELISYYAASAPTVMHGALVAKQAGRLDDSTARLATGPNYFVFRDSFRNRDGGDKTSLPQTWWYQRNMRLARDAYA